MSVRFTYVKTELARKINFYKSIKLGNIITFIEIHKTGIEPANFVNKEQLSIIEPLVLLLLDQTIEYNRYSYYSSQINSYSFYSIIHKHILIFYTHTRVTLQIFYSNVWSMFHRPTR